MKQLPGEMMLYHEIWEPCPKKWFKVWWGGFVYLIGKKSSGEGKHKIHALLEAWRRSCWKFFFFSLINYELKQQKRRKKYRYNKKLERTDTPIRLMDSRVYIVLTMWVFRGLLWQWKQPNKSRVLFLIWKLRTLEACLSDSTALPS